MPPDGDLCVIGDPDQAIYSFRGAEVGFFLRFAADFPAAREVRLTRNYRSTATVVDAALGVVAPATLVPGRTSPRSRPATGPEHVTVHTAADEAAEAAFVVGTIERVLGGSDLTALLRGAADPWTDAVHSYADFAVLYRTDAQSAALVDALEAAGVPYQKRSHHRLGDQPGVRELLGVLREDLVRAAGDRGRCSARRGRCLGPGCRGPGRAARSGRSTGPAGCPASAALPAPIGAAGRDRRRRPAGEIGADGGPGDARDRARGAGPAAADPARRVAELQAAVELLGPLAERAGADAERFLAELALGAEVDLWDPRADRVSLLTLHASKGLEFPVVFVVGCEDGLLPMRFGDEPGDPAEERRLLFVGMTRARTHLALSGARRRTVRGRVTRAGALAVPGRPAGAPGRADQPAGAPPHGPAAAALTIAERHQSRAERYGYDRVDPGLDG